MHGILKPLALTALLAAPALARDVPSNVRSLYNSIRGQGSCKNELKGGFYSQEKDSKNFGYCGDHLADYNILYLQGKNGQLVNMDIDCDGALGKGNGDCDSSGDTQGQTTFGDTVKSYNAGIKDVNAYVHSYVVLGNEGSKKGYVTFNPQQYGIEPLSVVAVVCGDKMFYGVWADTNGDDGPPFSLSLGQACYGRAVNGDAAHDTNDVLYIAFKGGDAVPGAKGAKWNASTFAQFEASLGTIGDKLVSRIGGSGSPNPPPPPPTGDCDWEGHCEGASCGSDDDCADELTCQSGTCAA
ncbi:Endo-chitosanase [Cladobotryum mycophilum]|uniref:Endo-chitosanase n=1 Tax=Cladobotryum mycophilum TaxID=491253 RepID=A0ABR0S7S4_9HYPO